MHAIKLISIVGSLAVVGSGFSQGFVNLDFESAMVSGYSPQSTISGTLAFPGWTLAGNQAFYDGISLGGALVSVNDINTGNGFSPLDGNFSAFLFGGIFNTPVSISQTALVPVGTTTIELWQGTFMGLGSFQLSLNGQIISMTTISSQSGYVLRAGDISAFAGSSATLQITALGVPTGPGPNPVLLDNIQFSSNPIPEPGTVSLLVIGLMGLLWHRRTKKQ